MKATLPDVVELLQIAGNWPGTPGQLRKFIEVAVQKKPSEEQIQRILNGHWADLLNANCDEADRNRPTIRNLLGLPPIKSDLAVYQFRTWKSIQLGTYKNIKTLKKAIDKEGCVICEWANNIMNNSAFTLSKTRMTVDLVKVTVGDLGFTKLTRYDNICKRAESLGLSKCPAEVGPQLRLQYVDQYEGEWLLVAMDAIRSGSKEALFSQPSLLQVSHNFGYQKLSANTANAYDRWEPYTKFLFVSPE